MAGACNKRSLPVSNLLSRITNLLTLSEQLVFSRIRPCFDLTLIPTMTKANFPGTTNRGVSIALCRLACLLLLTIGFSFPAYAASKRQTVGDSTPAALFHNYCSVCHGEKGDGKSRAQYSLNPPPIDFTTVNAAQMPRARMIEAVTNGRPGTAMSGWKTQLSPKEIESIVDYVRNTFMPASASTDSSLGRSIFSKNCSVCHGEKGDGKSRAQASLNPPPRDFTAISPTEMTQQRMITSVTFGRPDTAMSGFKSQLSQKEISAVVDYIRSSLMKQDGTAGISGTQAVLKQPATSPAQPQAPVAKAVAVNMSAAMPNGLRGDSVKGGGFYMTNCATCHGITGDGRGPRAYFINPKPRDFLHPASRQAFNRPALFTAISEGKRGTEMPAWDKVLTPQEIANVAEFVFQQFIHPSSDATKAAKTPK